MKTYLKTQQLAFGHAQAPLYQDLNWEIRAGECWGILGANGSGKTTLLHTLAGLKKPIRGTVELTPGPLQQLRRDVIAQELGLLLQQDESQFPFSVIDYLKLGRFAHKKTNCAQHNSDKPDINNSILIAEQSKLLETAIAAAELAALLKRPITTLSGGERRRVALALLLVQNPRVFLLDEPCNHLDVRYQGKLLAQFKNCCQPQIQPEGQTEAQALIMSSHDVNRVLHYCDKVLLLFPEGEYLFGQCTALITAENLERLYGCQFNKQALWERITS